MKARARDGAGELRGPSADAGLTTNCATGPCSHSRLALSAGADPWAWITRCRRTIRDYERLTGHHETMIYTGQLINTMRFRLARRRDDLSLTPP
jgi:hypothetical protein